MSYRENMEQLDAPKKPSTEKEEAAIQQITTDPESQMLQELVNENEGNQEIVDELMGQLMKKQTQVHHVQSDAMFRMIQFLSDRQESLEIKVGTALATLGRIESILEDLAGGRTPDASRISQSLIKTR